MTREDIIRMAREAGFPVEKWDDGLDEVMDGDNYHIQTDQVIDFANLVAAAEREACAKLCDEVGEDLYEALMRECRSNENVANNARAAAEVCSTELRNGRYAEVDQS